METKTATTFSVLKETEVQYLQSILAKGGPDLEDYPVFEEYVNKLNDQGIEELRILLKPILNKENMIGYGYVKPYGYAGDFHVIDMIYQVKTSDDPRYHKWDKWYHEQHAPQAVRNRKEFFLNLCAELDAKNDKPKEMLILGSGPAADVFEYLESNPDSRIHFDLLDLDQRAIDYAREKNLKYLDRLNFIRINVLRFKTHKFYDTIWSAGLFDYFKEKHFVYLVNKYREFIAEDGEMVIGNFADGNPSVKLMHVLCDWNLNLRSKEDLTHYAVAAGADPSSIRVDSEPLGVNLFLRIKNNKNSFKTAENFISWLEFNNN
ncbi:MAG: class I SAM-dependent methyltransferase [Chlorobi bacterium]|nr:class I SAM-dependent methyltransferase [Chlorobiota bacterium]